MKLEMFSVYDKAVKAFLPPFFARSRGEALRSFTTVVNDVKHEFHRYASDYTMFYLGSWDDAGSVFEFVEPVRVISALEVIVEVTPQPALLADLGKRPTGEELEGVRQQLKNGQ